MDTTTTLARRYFDEIFTAVDDAVIDELVAADAVGHVGRTTIQGADVLRQRVAAVHATYGTPRFTVHDVLAAGDRVAVRWTFTGIHEGSLMGETPTGRAVAVDGCSWMRVADGRIAEVWVSNDDLGELEQLGVLSVPAPA